MAVALWNTTKLDENLETYCLIWLDASVNNSRENHQAQQKLQAIINHILTFEDDQQCFQYIKNHSKDDRIILIVSGRFGRQIVPKIVNLRQITSVYVYCFDKKANDEWSQHFTKVKGVLVRLDELIQKIQNDYTHQQHVKFDESLLIKILDETQLSDEFFHSQLLIDCLIRMKSSPNDKNEFIAFCKQYYQNNNAHLMIINEFEKDYSTEQTLWWFTRHSFVSRLLNKAFRERNIDLLFLLRFFIHDLGYYLGKNRCPSLVHAYRGQLMPKDELQVLKNSVGKCMSINLFLSASISGEKVRSLLNATDLSENIEKVFFEITADPHLHNTKPFSSTQLHSYFPNAKGVIFMVGSIFRIDQIEHASDKIWNVRITLCSADDRQLKSFVESMKNELGTGRTSLLRFGHVLRRIGNLNNSEKYYRRSLNQLPNGHPDIPNCYQGLGMVAESKKDLASSLKWYTKSLEILLQKNDPNIADSHNSIANVYSKMGDYTGAMQSYEKALEIWKTTLGESHPRVAKCLNDIGVVYEMEKKYTEALECYQKAYQILRKTLSSKHIDVAITIRNIAYVYELKGEYEQALTFYEKAMKKFRYSLPSSQIYFDDMEKSKRRVSSKLK